MLLIVSFLLKTALFRCFSFSNLLQRFFGVTFYAHRLQILFVVRSPVSYIDYVIDMSRFRSAFYACRIHCDILRARSSPLRIVLHWFFLSFFQSEQHYIGGRLMFRAVPRAVWNGNVTTWFAAYMHLWHFLPFFLKKRSFVLILPP